MLIFGPDFEPQGYRQERQDTPDTSLQEKRGIQNLPRFVCIFTVEDMLVCPWLHRR